MHSQRFRWLMILVITFSPVVFSEWVFAEEQEKATSKWMHERSDLVSSPRLVFGQLPNGLRYVLMRNETPKHRVSMHLNVQVGSLHETDDQHGVAHFLEHLQFNGSEHYPPGELIAYFQRIGMDFGADANAHTGLTETVYDITLADNGRSAITEALVVLGDYAQGALLLPEEIEKERRVILSEMRDRDTISYRTFESTFRFELKGTRFPERLPIGTRKTVSAVSRDRIVDFYRTWYRPENMIVVMVGDFEPSVVEPLIVRQFARMTPKAASRELPPVGDVTHEGQNVFYHYEAEAGQTSISIETISTGRPPSDSVHQRREELLQSLGNRIVQYRMDALIEKQKAPFTSASIDSGTYLQRIKFSQISAHCNPEQWRPTLAVLEQQLRKAISFGFLESEVERAKKDQLGELDRAAETAATRESNHLARRIIYHVNNDRVMLSPRQSRDVLAPVLLKAAAEDIHGAFNRRWAPNHRLVLVTGNAKMDAGPTANQSILGVYNHSRDIAVTAPVEKTIVRFPYLPVPDTSGVITQRTVENDLGITRVTFKNGIQLQLKPTRFKANEVLASIVFGEGRRSEPVSWPGLALIAETVVNGSGVGDLDTEQLDRALAGKTAEMRFAVRENRFEFTGRSSTRELETLFQLFYAHLVDPAIRQTAYRLAVQRMNQSHAETGRTVRGGLEMHGVRFLAGGDSRFGTPADPAYLNAPLAAIRQWVIPAFSASPIEISLVGDFKPNDVVALASRYFGTLALKPELKKGSDSRPQPTFPMGKRKQIGIDSRLAKAMVVVAFPTAGIAPIERTRRLATLASVFSDQLRVRVREALGAAYSPFAFNRPSRAYPGYGVLMALVQVAPDQVATIEAVVKDIARELSTNGVSEDALERALKPTLSNVRDQWEKNTYWLQTVLAGASRQPEQLEWSRTIQRDYASITPEQLNPLAARFLNPTNAAVFVVVPNR